MIHSTWMNLKCIMVKKPHWGAWLVQSEEPVTPDLKIVGLSPMMGVENTKIYKEINNFLRSHIKRPTLKNSIYMTI